MGWTKGLTEIITKSKRRVKDMAHLHPDKFGSLHHLGMQIPAAQIMPDTYQSELRDLKPAHLYQVGIY